MANPRKQNRVPIYPRRRDDGSWAYDVKVRVNHKLVTRTANTMAQARIVYSRLRAGEVVPYAEPRNKALSDPDSEQRMTLDDLFEYNMRVRPPKAPGTAARYVELYDRYLRDAQVPIVDKRGQVVGFDPLPFGQWAIEDITEGAVQEVLVAMRSRQWRAGTGKRTIQMCRTLLSRMFNAGIPRMFAGPNPVTRQVKVDRPVGRDPVALSKADVVRLATAAATIGQNVQWGRMIRLNCWLGLRPGELLGLRVGDWNRQHKTLRVERSRGDRIGEEGPTKTGKGRTIPVMIPELQDLLTEQAGGRPATAPMFTARYGSHVGTTNFRRRVWDKAVERAGLHPTPVPHDMRHTAATLMAEAGLPLSMAQEVLGHMSEAMTEHYTHVSRFMQSKAEEQLTRHYNGKDS